MLATVERALIIVAHPDDAEVSAGGLIALMASKNIKVTVCNLTISEKNQQARIKRKKVASCSAELLGYDLFWTKDHLYNTMEEITEQKAVHIVEEVVAHHNPQLIITHSIEDSHVDHMRVARAVIAASRLCGNGVGLYSFAPSEYRTPFFTSFNPNTFINISNYMEKKLLAISYYNHENRNYRELKLDSIKSINAYYGTFVPCSYAEAFRLLRFID